MTEQAESMKDKKQEAKRLTESHDEQRIGITEGSFRKYKDIDFCNDEIAELFLPDKNAFTKRKA